MAQHMLRQGGRSARVEADLYRAGIIDDLSTLIGRKLDLHRRPKRAHDPGDVVWLIVDEADTIVLWSAPRGTSSPYADDASRIAGIIPAARRLLFN